MRRLLVLLALIAAGLGAGASSAPIGAVAATRAAAPLGAAAPTATTVTSIRAVGALFFPSVLGSNVLLNLPHECSGSVVHSPGHDLVLTAAHCVYGSGVTYDFVPGYHDGVAPYGIWSAQRVYVDAAWKSGHDPQHDYAFLQVAPHPVHGVRHNIEDITGAYTLGLAPAPGVSVTVDGYLLGVGGEPITCTAPVYYTGGYPSFDCGGFGDGTSGGPWLRGRTVVGVIGGLHQGGCLPSTSYTSAFGAATIADWDRAATHGPADFTTIPGGPGC